MVGTAMKTVTTPDARRSQVAVASKPPGASQVAPTHSGQSVTLTMPCTWWRGRTSRMRSSGVQAQASTMPWIWARREAWVCTTPFGRPVVPLVWTISAA